MSAGPPLRAPTAFLLHPSAALHDTGWGHPEHQGRLRALASSVGRDMLELHGRAEQVDAPSATPEDALLVHTGEHLERLTWAVQQAADTGSVVELEADTPVSSATWEAVLGSLGATLEASRLVLEGNYANAFVATRPPGHHATPSQAMGFCMVNHVACAARWLRGRGLDRVLIVDFDVHHGNGTQDTFWNDPSVFFLSFHQWPHYPGTGAKDERGGPDALGRTRNVTFAAGTPRDTYLDVFESAVDEVVGGFEPDFILVSAGFDCLAGDPLGRLLLEPEDVHKMTQLLRAHAEDGCQGRLVACLEGGYDPARTGAGAAALVRALAGLDPPPPPPESGS